MTRLIMQFDEDGSQRIVVVSPHGDIHGNIEDAEGIAHFNLGKQDLSEQPHMDGVILWTAPNASHPKPEPYDTILDEWIGVGNEWAYWQQNHDTDPLAAYDNGDILLLDPRFLPTEVEQ